jgi:hypothetical protein
MFSKVALTATLAATLVLAPAALANEAEVDDVMLIDEDAAAGRDLLLKKVVKKTKKVVVKKPKNVKKVEVHKKKSIAGDEGNEGNEGNEGLPPCVFLSFMTVSLICKIVSCYCYCLQHYMKNPTG